MSKYFERIKLYYEKGIYRAEHLKKFIASGALTEEEYKTITGEDYVV